MREILFRGRRTDTGELVYGFFAIREADSPDPYTDEGYKQYLILEVWEDGFIDYEVDPETVVEWTGLRDKKGVRIFEGDIVDISGWGRGYIDMIDGRYQVKRENDSFYWIGFCKTDHSHFEPVVIGNIHDNRELLEVKQ
ncbi:hypothetical protein FACS1894124_5090 [Spirochaetia bacterium]|nr:hypothetical protein FACS1894124_5090 [Spirochaetia bacterium]